MPTSPCYVYCADIGSMCSGRECKNNFGWAGRQVATNNEEPRWHEGDNMRDLVDCVTQNLKQGSKVALGFECPEWIPVRSCPMELTRARKGERRSWSAGPGATVLATGLAQAAWMLQAIRCMVPEGTEAFLKWEDYQESDRGLFLWEAYVSEKKNQPTGTRNAHIQDAKAAIDAFINAPSPVTSSITPPSKSQTLSLIGATLIWAGWSEELELLPPTLRSDPSASVSRLTSLTDKSTHRHHAPSYCLERCKRTGY